MRIRLLSNALAFTCFAVSVLVFSDSLSRLFALWFLLLTSYDGLSVWLFISGKGAQLGALADDLSDFDSPNDLLLSYLSSAR